MTPVPGGRRRVKTWLRREAAPAPTKTSVSGTGREGEKKWVKKEAAEARRGGGRACRYRCRRWDLLEKLRMIPQV